MRRRDAVRNRAKLLAAADAYLAEHGPPLAFNDLARYAGVGVGSVYRHFSDPDALLDALMGHRVDAVVAILERAESAEDPIAGLREAVFGICELRAMDMGIDPLLTGSRATFEATRTRVMPPTERIVERAKASGRMRPGFSTSDVGILLWLGGALHEYTGHADAGLWRRYVEALLDGLQAVTEPRRDLSVAALDAERMAVVVHGKDRSRRRAANPPEPAP
jgi:AcrR family transcriptional regulator